MVNPFFSVLVPSHNGMPHITKLLDSIVNQTYTDYELIVAADACDDDTAIIAREYGAEVIELNNHSEGKTRNALLSPASGEWILWADDDDWFLHEYVFDQLALMAGQHDEDILFFSFIFKGREHGYTEQTPTRSFFAVWNKCWRRSIVEGCFCPDVAYGADVGFTKSVYQKDPKRYYWNMPMYYYNYMRPGSLTWKYKHGEIIL